MMTGVDGWLVTEEVGAALRIDHAGVLTAKVIKTRVEDMSIGRLAGI
jgi:hypothetical protein